MCKVSIDFRWCCSCINVIMKMKRWSLYWNTFGCISSGPHPFVRFTSFYVICIEILLGASPLVLILLVGLQLCIYVINYCMKWKLLIVSYMCNEPKCQKAWVWLLKVTFNWIGTHSLMGCGSILGRVEDLK